MAAKFEDSKKYESSKEALFTAKKQLNNANLKLNQHMKMRALFLPKPNGLGFLGQKNLMCR